jgi:hypothetical protein
VILLLQFGRLLHFTGTPVKHPDNIRKSGLNLQVIIDL